METITLKIFLKPDRRELGEVSISRGLEISVTAQNPQDAELLNKSIKDIFKDGVRKFSHISEIVDKNGTRRTWIAEQQDTASPDLFETAIDMLETAGFEVEFPENAGRKNKLAELEYYLKNSAVEEGYKRLIETRFARLTERQILDIIKSFEEEFKELGKKPFGKSEEK